MHLVEAAGVNINMEYIHLERLIVEVHGVDIVGWPEDVLFANPSKITRIADLTKLHAALKEGACHWVQLSPEELEIRQAENFRRINSGEDPYAPRGGVKAKTAPRKRMHLTIDNGETTAGKKKQRTAAGKESDIARKETEMTGKDKRKGTGRGRGKSNLSREVITDQQEQEADQPLSNTINQP